MPRVYAGEATVLRGRPRKAEQGLKALGAELRPLPHRHNPRVGEERDLHLRIRNLPDGRLDPDTKSLEAACERLEIAHVESDVSDRAAPRPVSTPDQTGWDDAPSVPDWVLRAGGPVSARAFREPGRSNCVSRSA